MVVVAIAVAVAVAVVVTIRVAVVVAVAVAVAIVVAVVVAVAVAVVVVMIVGYVWINDQIYTQKGINGYPDKSAVKDYIVDRSEKYKQDNATKPHDASANKFIDDKIPF